MKGKRKNSSSRVFFAGKGLLWLGLYLLMAASCQPRPSTSQQPAEPALSTGTGEEKIGEGASADSDPALRFIRTRLYAGGEWKDMEPDERRYSVAYYDLNDSGEAEILLAIPTMNHCGSGGCRFWVLDQKGELLSSTSVADFPLGVSVQKQNGWRDLLTWSNGSHRILSWDGKAYSPNASTAKMASEDERKELTEVELLGKAFEDTLRF